MKRQIILLLLIVTLAATAAFAAPPETPWEITTTTVYADTLSRGLASDSVAYTSAVNVFGARAIIVDVQTTGITSAQNGGNGALANDTLGVGEPIFDVTGTGTYNTYAGGGVGKFMPGVEVATGGVISPTGAQIYRFYASAPGAFGGTPIPVTTRTLRFRLKGNNARRYITASLASLSAPTGTITVRVHVIR